MSVHIEAFILYIVIFFSQTVFLMKSGQGPETASFSIPSLLFTILIYIIPSLFLIWFLLYRKKKPEYRLTCPGKNDLNSSLITLPALLFTGLTVSLISAIAGAEASEPFISSPSSLAGWIMLCFYCILSAYLEESFFRFYLLSKKEELKLTAPFALAVSALLFGICHIYEGIWGVLNAFLAGILLGVIFLKYRTIHGIAIAHAFYNITAFALYAVV